MGGGRVNDPGGGIFDQVHGFHGRLVRQAQEYKVCSVHQLFPFGGVLALFLVDQKEVNIPACGKALIDLKACGAFLAVNIYLWFQLGIPLRHLVLLKNYTIYQHIYSICKMYNCAAAFRWFFHILPKSQPFRRVAAAPVSHMPGRFFPVLQAVRAYLCMFFPPSAAPAIRPENKKSRQVIVFTMPAGDSLNIPAAPAKRECAGMYILFWPSRYFPPGVQMVSVSPGCRTLAWKPAAWTAAAKASGSWTMGGKVL